QWFCVCVIAVRLMQQTEITYSHDEADLVASAHLFCDGERALGDRQRRPIFAALIKVADLGIKRCKPLWLRAGTVRSERQQQRDERPSRAAVHGLPQRSSDQKSLGSK